MAALLHCGIDGGLCRVGEEEPEGVSAGGAEAVALERDVDVAVGREGAQAVLQTPQAAAPDSVHAQPRARSHTNSHSQTREIHSRDAISRCKTQSVRFVQCRRCSPPHILAPNYACDLNNSHAVAVLHTPD
eukprot:3041013-Pleurochrysis_carterae.AAC.1